MSETIDKEFETSITISYEVEKGEPFKDYDGSRRSDLEVDYTTIQVNGRPLKEFPDIFRQDIVKLVDEHFEKGN